MIVGRHAVDLDLLREGAAVMSGTHNYTNFTTAIQSWQNPVKTLSIDVRPGHGFLQEYSPFYRDQFDHWDLCYNSNSFLYKQVSFQDGQIGPFIRSWWKIRIDTNLQP